MGVCSQGLRFRSASQKFHSSLFDHEGHWALIKTETNVFVYFRAMLTAGAGACSSLTWMVQSSGLLASNSRTDSDVRVSSRVSGSGLGFRIGVFSMNTEYDFTLGGPVV